MPQLFYQIGEIAALLGWSRQWTGVMLRRGDIPGERIGSNGRWRVRQVALKDFAKRNNITLDFDALEALQSERAERRRLEIAAHQAEQAATAEAVA